MPRRFGMHIPDGYLSPSTCAVLYAASAPFWYVALQRVKQALQSQTVPLIALFAAFSFVIMMFNLPLPGGTTGHAVGMGIASIVLGPWVSILAISMALAIQALFFGDGGITAFGANCFNMAIAGSLVSYAIYRLLSAKAGLRSRRRMFAAGLAGYAAINVAALLAAIEFGLQPLLFHDAAGVPLYAPYPLSVSIPAMLVGHLTFAGLAELVVSAGLVNYLQRADPLLLQATAPHAFLHSTAEVEPRPPLAFASRRLWLLLGVALLLTPLGILAIGSAWGEWTAADFSSPATRASIAAASRHQAPPAHVPAGLQSLAQLWAAPLARYEPSFIRNPALGYLLSAFLGVGLVLLTVIAMLWLLSRIGRASRFRRQGAFVERTITLVLAALQSSLFAEDLARARGVLQNLDARVKLAGFAALLLASISVHSLVILVLLLCAAVGAALASHLSLPSLARRTWLPVLAFTGVIALPALLLVPGPALLRLPLLGWNVSQPGLQSAALLALRAETAATLSMLLLVTTPWARLLRSLRFFRLPLSCVLVLEMSHRYIFLLLQTAAGMLEARRARHVGPLTPADRRRLAAASAGVLLDKCFALSRDVHTAMSARGYRGEVFLLDDLRMRRHDWLQLTLLLTLAVIFIWWGR